MTKAELRSRGITRYDAEMLLAQGYSLPESRVTRRASRNSATSASSSSSNTCSSSSNTSTDNCITSSTDLTHVQSSNNTDSTSTEPNTKSNSNQKVPKLKLRLSRLSDTETDSSVTGGTTPQPLYEILDNKRKGLSDQEDLLLDDSSQSTIISQDENCSQSSVDEFSDQIDDSAYTAHCQFKRIRLKFDGKVVVNLEHPTT